VPDILHVCFDEMPLGSIATNGFKKIPESVGYKLHISVWGNDDSSDRIRNAKNLLMKQIENYKDDPRAVFVYTFTSENVNEIYEIMETIAANNCKITFNMFSSPVGYTGHLRHTAESRLAVRKAMIDVLVKYPDNVLFSYYNITAHTSEDGLHDLYSCSYPRMNPSEDIGLGKSFRQYRADLSWDRNISCCVPDTDCPDCRHYAAASAVVTARLYRHAINPDHFRSWLDFVDTYLAVWVMGYEKGKNLCNKLIPAPGREL
jgi:hypothetical protein